MTASGEGEGEGEELVVRRVLPVPRERVFEASLDPASLSRWMRPGPTADATVEVDARVGGRFRIVMRHGRETFEHRGEYLAIDPPARLVFTWISAATDARPTLVAVELHERADGCELVLIHRRLPAPSVDAHRKGWGDIVRKLEEALAGRA